MNKVKFINLDNGLTILMYTDKSKMTNHVELRTFLGGLNLEYQDVKGTIRKIPQGTAHLLEHYICECNNSGNYIDELLKLKVLNANASTSKYDTNFYFNTVYNFEECLITLLNSVYNVEFNKEKLDKTKFAVYHEIRDEKDKQSRKIINAHTEINYGKKIDILGSKKSISGVTSKLLEDIYKIFYVPKNQFLLLAGTFDEEKIIKLIKDFYSKYTFLNNKRYYGIQGVSKIYDKEVIIEGNKVDEVFIKYKIPIDKLSCFEKYKQDWYISYFIDINLSRFSKLNEQLKKDNIITADISSYTYNINGYKILEIGAYTTDKNEFIKMVHEVVNNNCFGSEDEFELVKKDSILHLSVRSDNISDYVIPVLENYIEFDYLENDNMKFVEELNYKEYKEILGNINFSEYSLLTIKGNK